MTSEKVLASAFEQGQQYFKWLNTLHGPIDSPIIETVEKACGIIWDRKGKRLRCHFVYWFAEPYKISSEELELYAWAVEAIHTATLLHDDVIDKAETRRSGPSANQVFDNTIPVLSGDYLMSDAIHQLAIRGIPPLMQGMCVALKELSQGEILQYQNQYKIADSEKFYHLVCELKTASLLKWAASVGAHLRCKDEVLPVVRFTCHYGLLYQLTDDLLDLRGTHTKPTNQDLREGKVNWAAWKIIQNEPKIRTLLLQDFSHKRLSDETELKLLEAFNQPYNQKILNLFLESTKNECLRSVEKLKSNSLRQLLRTLIDFTAGRVF